MVKGSIHDYGGGIGPPRVPTDTSHISPVAAQPDHALDARRPRRSAESSGVLVSAVVSTYLLTHLHHVLQQAEYSASQEGRSTQAANATRSCARCSADARSMEDASALGQHDDVIEQAA